MSFWPTQAFRSGAAGPGARRPPPSWNGRSLLALLLALAALSTLSCGLDEQPILVDLAKREEIGYREDPGTITYAYVPQYFHKVSFERHNPLVEYLKRETGLSIRQVFPDSFDDYIRKTGQGKIDISFANPFVYIKVNRRYGVEAFARIVELDGKENFRGQIICRSDNDAIRTIEDCRGKRWVAVDPSSAGGYLYALGLFWDHGIRKEDFAEISFVPGPGGQQEKVVLAVYSGRYDIGSVREGTLELVSDKIDLNQIRSLGYTPWYPGWMYSARRGLPPETVSSIRDALLRIDCLDNRYRAICDAAHFAGIIPARDQDYDTIRELAAKVGIDPSH
ncbi:MAG: phosphate/phosphite/phosphonate ABC transporter substrate-binding protein [Syntrophobacteraceae bacterium]|jgi:phosphonate transport system substrate-binding protein|nr:phosphate/phosphite/phosphonate ABC transporter substrate-binding protein [Syntrophobacteraceae bacterium]